MVIISSLHGSQQFNSPHRYVKASNETIGFLYRSINASSTHLKTKSIPSILKFKQLSKPTIHTNQIAAKTPLAPIKHAPRLTSTASDDIPEKEIRVLDEAALEVDVDEAV